MSLSSAQARAITLKRLLNFITIVEEGAFTEAARAVEDQLGEGSRSSLTQNLNKLTEAFDRPLLVERDGRKVPTELGEELLEYARQMVDLWKGSVRLGSSTVVLAFLPQHAFFVSPAILSLRDKFTIHNRVLGEQDRSAEVFETHVIGPLAGGEIDLVVGPPPKPVQRRQQLTKNRLYTSQLEAMIQADDPRTEVTVQELVENDRLLVPPRQTRSRRMLEGAIRDEVKEDPGTIKRVSLETYSTKALVAFGEDRHGTVVVPSDIANPFKHGNILAGPASKRFKWIPVVRGNGHRLTHDVFATHRRRPRTDVTDLVKALREAVQRFGLDISAQDS